MGGVPAGSRLLSTRRSGQPPGPATAGSGSPQGPGWRPGWRPSAGSNPEITR